MVAVFGIAGPIAAAIGLSYPYSRCGASSAHRAPVVPESLPFDWHAEARPLPAVSFTDPAGRVVSLADYRGRYVLFNLWATWCAPCLREMPALDRLKGVLEGPDFAVVLLNQDRAGMAVVEPYWARHDFQHIEIFLDQGLAAGRALKPKGLPTTVLIDPAGRERARLEGIAEWDGAAALAFFRALAGGG